VKYFIKTFGCQQNVADSERIETTLIARGMNKARNYCEADYIVINTCMIRETAENRVYGLVNNLEKLKSKNNKLKIIVTGCMAGMALHDKTGKFLRKIRKAMPAVNEFTSLENVGFDNLPTRKDNVMAWIPISNGCNNFCTYCVVPFTRGREISRPFEDVIREAKSLILKGYKNVTLLGQNVNSYGADLVLSFESNKNIKGVSLLKYKKLKPVYVKHLGRYRIPTLFPNLLERIAKIGFEKVDFLSSNPWDFSDELIDVIRRNTNITRTIHLPVQSGDSHMLKKMNRWYTPGEYLDLVSKLKYKIKNLKLTTDIIVGFSGETVAEFNNTVKLCRKVGFEKAYISMYSPRPMTVASKMFQDDVPHTVKKKRWRIMENLINFKYQKRQLQADGLKRQLRDSNDP